MPAKTWKSKYCEKKTKIVWSWNAAKIENRKFSMEKKGKGRKGQFALVKGPLIFFSFIPHMFSFRLLHVSFHYPILFLHKRRSDVQRNNRLFFIILARIGCLSALPLIKIFWYWNGNIWSWIWQKLRRSMHFQFVPSALSFSHIILSQVPLLPLADVVNSSNK